MKGQARVHLSGKPMDTLVLLASRPGQLVAKSQLQQEIWGGSSVTNSAIEQTIHRIRVVLEDNRELPIYIETIQGEGYRFIGDVDEVIAPIDVGDDTSVSASRRPFWTRIAFSRLRANGRITWISIILTVVGLCGGVGWVLSPRTSQPSSFTVSGRTLSVFDDEKRLCWRHTFDEFPASANDSTYPRVLFSDLDTDGEFETLFVYTPLDARGVAPPSSGSQLYCFSRTGHLRWSKPFGTGFRTPRGRSYPAALYSVSLLGRLAKPRKDGGVIIVGGHLGGTWVYEVEIYTAAGERVGSYLHPGWFFAMAIVDLNRDGNEEIVLGGVNNGFGEHGYAATLVVLDSRRIEGQGSTPPGDDRRAVGYKTGTETGSILLRDFAPAQNDNTYCAVHSIVVADDLIDVKVSQDGLTPTFVHYRFDQHLRLTSVQPELSFEKALLREFHGPDTNSARQEFLMKRLGQLRIIRNEFSSVTMSPVSH